MLFNAYLGANEYVEEWQAAMHQHAVWLGLVDHITTRRLASGHTFAFGWLQARMSANAPCVSEIEEYLIVSTWRGIRTEYRAPAVERERQPLATAMSSNTIQMGISLQSGELIIAVPPATPEQFYYSKDYRGYAFSNDMRSIIRWAGLDLDERAVYALFQYGAIPAPLTMSKKVQRVPNGHVVKIMPEVDNPTLKILFQPSSRPLEDNNVSDPAEHIQKILDSILTDLPSSAILYFSGGVDSGLMAARLAQIGRSDVQLVNYIFGPQDPEGDLALRMAAHLGLNCEQIMYKPRDILSMLQRIATDYSFPFGDYSVIPTNLLVQASLQSIQSECTVIEGTGADGAFGKWTPKPKMASLPKSIRWLIGETYKWLELWQYDTATEYRGQNARQSLRMPRSYVEVIAQNALDGIAYDIPIETRRFLVETIQTRIWLLSDNLNAEERYSLLDIIHICAGEFAVKSFDPLRMRGVKSVYPFLEPDMLQLSLSLPYTEKCAGGQSKSILKKLAVRYIPQDMIYRPKSGFIPPFKEMLADAEMQGFVNDLVLSQYNPLIGLYRKNVLQHMFERAAHRQSLSDGAYKFLWVLFFTSVWLYQLERN